MKSRREKTYRKPHSATKTIIKVFLIIIAVLIALAVFCFFYFQRYIVYLPDGIRLDLPF
ncbi:MAG: hypothetical protein II784_01155 [Oscillospiraceae bacterium]|nr:hypothetical protein [Oscillospiraceae bacterium]